MYNPCINLGIRNDVQDKKVEDCAQKLSCYSKQLKITCLNCSGKTPIDIIHEPLTHKANKMLIFDQKLITDVTNKLNFRIIVQYMPS